MLFYYVRHGDPIYNPDSLTPLGQIQAEAVGRRLAMHGIDKIYASTSQRAILTTTPLAEMLHKDIEQVYFANEDYTFKELTYKTPTGPRWQFELTEIKEFFLSDEIAALGDKWYTHPKFAEYDYEAGLSRIARESDAFFEKLG